MGYDGRGGCHGARPAAHGSDGGILSVPYALREARKRVVQALRRRDKRFIPLGICSFLAQISLVAAMAATNNMIRKYGALDPVFGLAEYAQIPMAVVGIVMKFFQIIMSVCIGMAAGCIPIVGYNMGAEKYGRVRGLFTRLLICEAAAGAIATLIVELFPTGLIAIFGAANESAYYTEFAVKCFRIYLCMMPLACVNKAAFIFLQAMGKAVASTALSMIREIVFGVGLVLVLPLVWGLDGVIISMPAADILAFIASAIVIIYTYRTLKKMRAKARLNKKSRKSNLPGLSCVFIYAMFSSAFMNFGLLGMNI